MNKNHLQRECLFLPGLSPPSVRGGASGDPPSLEQESIRKPGITIKNKSVLIFFISISPLNKKYLHKEAFFTASAKHPVRKWDQSQKEKSQDFGSCSFTRSQDILIINIAYAFHLNLFLGGDFSFKLLISL